MHFKKFLFSVLDLWTMMESSGALDVLNERRKSNRRHCSAFSELWYRVSYPITALMRRVIMWNLPNKFLIQKFHCASSTGDTDVVGGGGDGVYLKKINILWRLYLSTFFPTKSIFIARRRLFHSLTTFSSLAFQCSLSGYIHYITLSRLRFSSPWWVDFLRPQFSSPPPRNYCGAGITIYIYTIHSSPSFFFRLARWAVWFYRNKFSYFFYSQATSVLQQPILLVTSFSTQKSIEKILNLMSLFSALAVEFSPAFSINVIKFPSMLRNYNRIALVVRCGLQTWVWNIASFFIHIPIETLKRMKENV